MQVRQKTKLIRIGIDASNISGGGGVTHLVEVLKVANPSANDFSELIIWGGKSILSQVAERPWITKIHLSVLDKGVFYRAYWQRFQLSRLAESSNCDVLLIPGGSYVGSFHPIVTYSRNLLPFEWRELCRFGWSRMSFKLILLRLIQSRTLRNADAVIFLTRYARQIVMGVVKKSSDPAKIIPHGVDDQFRQYPREQLSISTYSINKPFRIIYVSEIAEYKHQRQVAEAIIILRNQGYPICIDFVGGANSDNLKLLNKIINRQDLNLKNNCIRYLGKLPHNQLHLEYKKSDLFLFASSCENMPNILLEGMASGLPIACSNKGPMPEILNKGGVYFNPEKPIEIVFALKKLIDSPQLRSLVSQKSFERSLAFTWSRCANETFRFVKKVSR
jgi:glycosyltransferase involved in cell wall biosynthesis